MCSSSTILLNFAKGYIALALAANIPPVGSQLSRAISKNVTLEAAKLGDV
jgi:hypothetical protein